MIDDQIRSTLLDLLNLTSVRKVKYFVVGGTLRDHLLNKKVSDIDLTGKNAAELGIQFAQSSNFSYVPLDKTPGRATTRIILPHNKHFDLTDIQGTTIEEDLGQRDFTINAMGQELSDFLSNEKSIIDPHNGKEDLNKALIKATSPAVFEADPLRMLRAFRFAATMNFSIDENTFNDISKNSKKISNVAGERIWQELTAFLMTENTGDLVNQMKKSGLLNCLLPVSSFPDWVEFLSCYYRLEHILSKPGLYFNEQFFEMDSKEKALIKLSLFFTHADTELSIKEKRKKDFGTPKTFKILKDLKASNNKIAFICQAVQSSGFLSGSLPFNLSNSSLYDLCVMCGNGLVAGVLLQACTLPFSENDECEEVKVFNLFSKLLKFYIEQYIPVLGEKALLNGNDIIRKFNVLPSPVLGNVLNNIQRAQVLGEIKTSSEAEMLAEKILKSQEEN